MERDQLNQLAVYAVYKNPSDYPNKYVIRRWVGEIPDKEPLVVSDDLDFCRSKLPKHLVRLLPNQEDDPCILETWL